jgi:hypothetical protein
MIELSCSESCVKQTLITMTGWHSSFCHALRDKHLSALISYLEQEIAYSVK